MYTANRWLGLRVATLMHLPCTFPVPSPYLPRTFPVPSPYLPCTFPQVETLGACIAALAALTSVLGRYMLGDAPTHEEIEQYGGGHFDSVPRRGSLRTSARLT